jgi:hypothetical protein
MEDKQERTVQAEVEIEAFAAQGEAVPDAKIYKVRIDDDLVTVESRNPSGEMLLAKVHRRPCAYEIIEILTNHEKEVIEPEEHVDLRKHQLKGFITAHKEIVQIFIDGNPKPDPYSIERGDRSVADILAKVGKTPEAYILLEEKDGVLTPLPGNLPVKIRGCEVFHTQVQTGASS